MFYFRGNAFVSLTTFKPLRYLVAGPLHHRHHLHPHQLRQRTTFIVTAVSQPHDLSTASLNYQVIRSKNNQVIIRSKVDWGHHWLAPAVQAVWVLLLLQFYF